MGVIFVCILLGLWYVWHTNMWNVQMLVPLFTPSEFTTATSSPQLSIPDEWSADIAAEGDWLEQIDEETRLCFEAELGSERVAEIEAGDMPTTMEMWRGSQCL